MIPHRDTVQVLRNSFFRSKKINVNVNENGFEIYNYVYVYHLAISITDTFAHQCQSSYLSSVFESSALQDHV